MKLPALITGLLAVSIALVSPGASAAHDKSGEKYDGTVDTIRWMESSVDLSTVRFRDQYGKQIALSAFGDKIVLLNLWAGGCVPCIREMPLLDRLQRRLGGEQFVVVAVSLDDNPEMASQVLNQLSIDSLPAYYESPEVMGRHFPVDILPASFFLDRNMRAIGLVRNSVNWDDEKVDKLIARLVDGVTPATLRAEQAQRQQ